MRRFRNRQLACGISATSKALGLTVPSSLLATADEVIEFSRCRLLALSGHFNRSRVCPLLEVVSTDRRNTLSLTAKVECLVISQRFRRGFTAAEKTELWDRWQRGESLKAIGRTFGKPSSSIWPRTAGFVRLPGVARGWH
jgi:hypothetical protein